MILKPIRRAQKIWQNHQIARLARRNDFDPAGNLLIFSDPRGGSTWLTELVQTVPATALLWEPLHLRTAPQFRHLGFNWRQYIPADAEWPEARAAFELLFRGKTLGERLCSRTSVTEIEAAERLIVKFCRGNALLPWLTAQFDFTFKPLLLLRHPFAVAASQLAFGAWNRSFRGFNIPNGPFNDRYLAHQSFLESLKTKEEALVATWCLTNGVPLEHPSHDRRWIPIFYEHLLFEPEHVIEQIFAAWGLPVPDGILDRVRVASATTRDATFERSLHEQVTKWQRSFTPEQIERMSRVLDYFEIGCYTAEPLPVVA